MHSSSVPWQVLSSTIGVGVLTDGWTLAEFDPELEGDHAFTVEIVFSNPFVSVPVVHLGITGFDIDQRDSARVTVKAENITQSGFRAVVGSWAGTRVYSVEFNWFAIGA